MRKNNIDGRLLTHGLRAMCAANFLLYAAVYMLLGVLPMALADDATCIYPAFLAGMLLVGPFHAYLADAFKRKHILLLSYTGVGITMAVASYIYEAHYAWLALLQGACFALASGAGTTISIDITLSGHRTSGNMLFASCGRVGMVAGLTAGAWGIGHYPLAWLSYASALLCAIGILLCTTVYVSFRAPIGLKLCSLDRFLLGRAWLPALNVGILAFSFGIIGSFLTGLSASISWIWMLPMLVLPLLTPLWVKMFVKLSHHCQRATGNMTFNLLMDGGLIIGTWTMCVMNSQDKVPIGEDTLAISALVLAILMFVFATRPYYKKKRVR